MYNNKSANIFIQTLGSPGLSQITFSLYEKDNKTYLVLKFVPCIGQDDMGADEFCKITFQSTAIDCDGAISFYPTVKAALEGPDSKKEIMVSLPCGSNATLTFEYKSEQNGHMGAYLVISKNNQTIPFRFETHQFRVYNSEGKWVTIATQTGLRSFVKILDDYIKRSRADSQANKLPKDFNAHLKYFPIPPSELWNNVNI